MPLVPHLALWDRLTDYDPAELDGLMTSRAVVRTQLMRTTIHTVTAADALALRPLLQPVLDRTFSSTAWGSACAARTSPRWSPRRRICCRAANGPRGVAARAGGRHPVSTPRRSRSASATGCRGCSRRRGGSGALGCGGDDDGGAWLDGVGSRRGRLDDLVVRYLGAFGPACVDVQAWCGLTPAPRGRRPARPAVAAVPDARTASSWSTSRRRPAGPGHPGTVRFLAEYDNVLLSHADRSRVVAEGDHVPLQGGPGGWTGTVLVDGSSGRPGRPARGDGLVLAVRPLGGPVAWSTRRGARGRGRLLGFLAPATRRPSSASPSRCTARAQSQP